MWGSMSKGSEDSLGLVRSRGSSFAVRDYDGLHLASVGHHDDSGSSSSAGAIPLTTGPFQDDFPTWQL